MKRPTILTLAFIAMALVLSTGVALAESQLDAQYSDLSTMRDSAVIASDSAAAELFFPRSTGELDKVSVYLGQNGTDAPTGEVIASIQSVTTIEDPEIGVEYSEPSGTKLGEGSISAGDHVPVDGSFSWVDIPLSRPAAAETNQSLALVLETTSGSSGYTWGAGLEYVFCGGFCSNPAMIRQNGTWSSFPSGDNFFFKTYVDGSGTNPPPPPSDAKPPETIITSGPNDLTIENGLTNDNTPTFSFSGTDNTSAKEKLLYSYKVEEDDNDGVDEPTWSSYSFDTSVTPLTSLSDGKYIFSVKAKDEAGNVGVPVTRHFQVDATAPRGTVSINNGALRTRTQSATLTLSATDPSPGSGVTEMRISDTLNGLTSASWEPYSTTKPWTLTAAKGTKTVYVQYRDGAHNPSEIVTDTITYR